jgi:hypothetical protein
MSLLFFVHHNADMRDVHRVARWQIDLAQWADGVGQVHRGFPGSERDLRADGTP